MQFPVSDMFDRVTLEVERAVWFRRKKIAWQRLREASSDEELRAAREDLRAARKEHTALNNLLLLMTGENSPGKKQGDARAKRRITQVMNPPRPKPAPDRKRDKRLQDRERTAHTKGHNPAPPQHGWRKKHK
jgi:hypothetical protein